MRGGYASHRPVGKRGSITKGAGMTHPRDRQIFQTLKQLIPDPSKISKTGASKIVHAKIPYLNKGFILERLRRLEKSKHLTFGGATEHFKQKTQKAKREAKKLVTNLVNERRKKKYTSLNELVVEIKAQCSFDNTAIKDMIYNKMIAEKIDPADLFTTSQSIVFIRKILAQKKKDQTSRTKKDTN